MNKGFWPTWEEFGNWIGFGGYSFYERQKKHGRAWHLRCALFGHKGSRGYCPRCYQTWR